jgi:hypothetical protein
MLALVNKVLRLFERLSLHKGLASALAATTPNAASATQNAGSFPTYELAFALLFTINVF